MGNWIDKLDNDVHQRLCNCHSTRDDLPLLVDAKWLSYKEKGKDLQGFKKEDALVSVLELLESNGQWELADLSKEEYDKLI